MYGNVSNLNLVTILYLLFISLEGYSQSNNNTSILDTAFVYEITDNETSCRDCSYYDYYLLLHIKYGEIEKDIIVLDDYLKYYLSNYLKIKDDKDYIRTLLLSNKRVLIPARKSKKLDSDVYNGFFDVDYSDSVFSSLLKDKDAFLNYYFDENKEYKFGERYREVYDEERYIHNKLFEAAAVISQLLKWGIPVYFYSEYKNLRYGYYKK